MTLFGMYLAALTLEAEARNNNKLNFDDIDDLIGYAHDLLYAADDSAETPADARREFDRAYRYIYGISPIQRIA